MPVSSAMFRTVFVLVLALWPTLVHANMAQTSSSGKIAAEPEIPAPQVRIEREVLSIDLGASLARNAKPRIEARYELVNDGPSVSIPVRFVSSGAAAATVVLDGTALPTRTTDEPIPESWSAAMRHGPVLQPADDALDFTLVLTPGPHTLLVAYACEGGWIDTKHERETSVEYLLAPARHWGGFATLEVRVRAPEDAEVIANLALQPVDGEWRGTFEGLPADALHVRARKVQQGTVVAYYALLGLLPVMIVAWLRWLPAMARGSKRSVIATSLALALAWAGALVLWMMGLAAVTDEGVYAVVFLGPFVALGAALVTGLLAAHHARRAAAS